MRRKIKVPFHVTFLKIFMEKYFQILTCQKVKGTIFVPFRVPFQFKKRNFDIFGYFFTFRTFSKVPFRVPFQFKKQPKTLRCFCLPKIPYLGFVRTFFKFFGDDLSYVESK
jgi:hypothetical protein